MNVSVDFLNKHILNIFRLKCDTLLKHCWNVGVYSTHAQKKTIDAVILLSCRSVSMLCPKPAYIIELVWNLSHMSQL